MSRTYAHVPYKVAVEREGLVDHNHENGECVTYSHKQSFLSYSHNVNGRCKKVLNVEHVRCEHVSSKKFVRTITNPLTKEKRNEVLKECPDGRVLHPYRFYGFLMSTTHYETYIDRDDSRECACDELPSQRDRFGSCSLELPFYKSRKYYASYDSWDYEDDRFQTSNEVRMNLLSAANSWNAMTPEEREDFDWDTFTR